MNGISYPTDGVDVKNEKKYPIQNIYLKIFYKEYVGEQLMIPFKTYTDMKKYYPLRIFDLNFQVDQITPKRLHLFKEGRVDPFDARIFATLITQRQVKKISDGKNLSKFKFY